MPQYLPRSGWEPRLSLARALAQAAWWVPLQAPPEKAKAQGLTGRGVGGASNWGVTGPAGTEAGGTQHQPSPGLQSWECYNKCPRDSKVGWQIPEGRALAAGWPQSAEGSPASLSGSPWEALRS